MRQGRPSVQLCAAFRIHHKIESKPIASSRFLNSFMPPSEIKPVGSEGSVCSDVGNESSTSPRNGVVGPGEVMRRASKWIPVYTVWRAGAGDVMAVKDVDPGRLQCTVTMVTDGSGGAVRCNKLRFLNPEGLEWYLDHAERCAQNDRHHRCTCCLEWIYRCVIMMPPARYFSQYRSPRVCPPPAPHTLQHNAPPRHPHL